MNSWNPCSKTTANFAHVTSVCARLSCPEASFTLSTGGYSLTFMDEYVHSLLTEERVCDIILPRLPKRQVLEENGDLGPRKSRLLDAMQANSDAGSQPRSPSRSLSSRSRSSSDAASRYRSRSPSRSRSTSPFRSRSRSISPDRFQLDQS